MLALGAGWLIAQGDIMPLFILAALTGMCTLALTHRGLLLGILVLAVLNGLPLINTSQTVASKLTVEDFATIALILVAALWWAFDHNASGPGRRAVAVSRLGTCLLMWWCLTFARSLIAHEVPPLRAVAFSRDFLYFALLLSVLPRVTLASRDIRALVGLLTGGACLFAVGQILIATGFGQPGNLIHFEYSAEQSGLTRVYSNMTDLVNAALAISVAACLLATDRRLRALAAPVALLLSISVVVQLTRARWIGLLLGLILVSVWLASQADARTARILRRRLTLLLGALVTITISAALLAPSLGSSGTIFQRAISIFSDLQSSSGTVAVRTALSKTMLADLGEHWSIGLGFVPPYSHYYIGLRSGSIRDPDVGVLNALMTMGLVGALLLYAPIALVLSACLRRSAEATSQTYRWLRYGGAVWLVAALVSSLTLVTLFSTSGLALTAVVLAVLVHPDISPPEALAAKAPSTGGGPYRITRGAAANLTPSPMRS